MDPNTLSNLDPKLKETYEKVMGTNVTPPASSIPDQVTDASPATPQSAPTAPINAEAPPVQNQMNGSDGLSAPVQTPPVENINISSESPQTVTINQPLPNPAETSILPNKSHGHMGLIKVFYVLGATVFFVIYIFFWMKIFNLQLPF